MEVAAGLFDEARGEKDLESFDERRRIARVLDAMSSTLRVPLLLRDLDGMTYQEIAEQLDIGLSAVKMRIKRAREEFRQRYDEVVAGEVARPPAESGRNAASEIA